MTIRPGHESTPRRLVRNHIRSGDRVLEVGAGIGGVTSEMVEVADFVIACEPQEDAFSSLVSNVPEAVALPLGVTIGGTELKLYRTPEFWNTSFWLPETEQNQPKKKQQLGRTFLSVDANRIIRSLNINVLVMDCEGYESVILNGLDSFALDQLRMVAVELHPKKCRTVLLRDGLERLTEAGFEMVEEELAHPEPGLFFRVYLTNQS